MRTLALALAIAVSASLCRAGYNGSGDTQIAGQVGVGTTQPRARVQIQTAPGDLYALKISSQDATPLMVLDKTGKLGIQNAYPQGDIDVSGTGDNGSVGLQLRAGNSSSTIFSSQLVLAYSTGLYQNSIRTQAESDQNLVNNVSFFLWNSTGQPTSMGNLDVLSLQAVPYNSTASVHVLPVGTPDVELEVSNGVSTGGGTIHRAVAQTHSSRELKTDIAYLQAAEAERALNDVLGLKPAWFRYKRVSPKGLMTRDPSIPLMRGLIYEDSPDSIKGSGKTLVLDNRLANLELALKAVNGKIESLSAEIIALEKSRKGK